ncbi:MAG: 4-hydroxy-tetrahydrodipicolinate synthase [Chitinophagales bacterium]|nr:4-hydroxy-tetrahydrodipicolinate synthase [Chitinophagales bacterium]
MKKFSGTGVALITPFNEKGHVDYDALQKLIDYNINNGIDYIVSLGTTGESVVLSKEEKKEILQFTVNQVAGRVPVVAGFGGNNTSEIIKSIEKQDFTGIDAILSVSPYYNKPTQRGIIAHYKAISNIAPRPVLLYNVPSRTGSNIQASTAIQLAKECDNIIGIKEASGDFSQAMYLVKHRPENFLLISGDDNLTLGLIAYGFDGVISVVAQAFPKMFSLMVKFCLRSDFYNARELHYKLNEITDMLFAEGNPAGIKYTLQLLGIGKSYLRLPLVNISEELQQKIEKSIQQLEMAAV